MFAAHNKERQCDNRDNRDVKEHPFENPFCRGSKEEGGWGGIGRGHAKFDRAEASQHFVSRRQKPMECAPLVAARSVLLLYAPRKSRSHELCANCGPATPPSELCTSSVGLRGDAASSFHRTACTRKLHAGVRRRQRRRVVSNAKMRSMRWRPPLAICCLYMRVSEGPATHRALELPDVHAPVQRNLWRGGNGRGRAHFAATGCF